MSGFWGRYWLIIAAVLAISLITGGIFLGIRLSRLQPVEIVLKDVRAADITGDIYIDGAVYRPGFYPVKSEDTLAGVISAAGVSDNADLAKIMLHVPDKSGLPQPQKINLNRAEPWLLQALPGIGEGRAKTIVEYRNKNGPFRSIDDLLKIEGFGKAIVDNIKDLVCVED